MKILITGINGFVGQHVAAWFLAQGEQVTGVGTREICSLPNVAYVQADLCQESAVERLVQAGPFDVVLHFAASLEMNDPDTLRINTRSTRHVLQAAKQAGCGLFVHLSSIPIVGAPPESPVAEETPPAPQTVYHRSKYAAEQLVMESEYKEMLRYNVRIASPVPLCRADLALRRSMVKLRRAAHDTMRKNRQSSRAQ